MRLQLVLCTALSVMGFALSAHAAAPGGPVPAVDPVPVAPPTIASIVAKIQADEKTCMDSAQSNVDMETCSANAYQAADKALNLQYQAAEKTLKAGELTDRKTGIPAAQGSKEILRRMILSERAWISYRNDECSLESTEMLGGTGEGLVFSDCMVQTTLDRMTKIDSILNSEN